jgi:hypothetical protein
MGACPVSCTVLPPSPPKSGIVIVVSDDALGQLAGGGASELVIGSGVGTPIGVTPPCGVKEGNPACGGGEEGPLEDCRWLCRGSQVLRSTTRANTIAPTDKPRRQPPDSRMPGDIGRLVVGGADRRGCERTSSTSYSGSSTVGKPYSVLLRVLSVF